MYTCFKVIAVFLFYIFALCDEENLGGWGRDLRKTSIEL